MFNNPVTLAMAEIIAAEEKRPILSNKQILEEKDITLCSKVMLCKKYDSNTVRIPGTVVQLSKVKNGRKSIWLADEKTEKHVRYYLDQCSVVPYLDGTWETGTWLETP